MLSYPLTPDSALLQHFADHRENLLLGKLILSIIYPGSGGVMRSKLS